MQKLIEKADQMVLDFRAKQTERGKSIPCVSHNDWDLITDKVLKRSKITAGMLKADAIYTDEFQKAIRMSWYIIKAKYRNNFIVR